MIAVMATEVDVISVKMMKPVFVAIVTYCFDTSKVKSCQHLYFNCF